jgi:hypothetical protein
MAAQPQTLPSVATPGAYATVVEIGGLPIRLRTDDASFLRLVQKRYAGFLNSDADTNVQVTVDLVAPGRVSRQEEVCVTRSDAGRWRAERADFCFEWDPESGAGKLRQSANPYSIDGVLRILHTLVLARQGGFLLHAASAIRNGGAFLFFGRSGAGKTTIIRSAPPGVTLLTDEISYVRRDTEGYVAHGTPFTGELARLGENVSAPVEALYHLAQAPRNRLTLMKPAAAARALLESVLFFADDPELVKLVFQSACDIVGRLRVYQLEFTPDQRVWDLIR